MLRKIRIGLIIVVVLAFLAEMRWSGFLAVFELSFIALVAVMTYEWTSTPYARRARRRR
jgi:1,4-dihydroxy-2-naphthoate octaprenyltransferase